MGIEAPAKVKYAIIYAATRNDNNMLSISHMCMIAGVSRSGYYAWLEAAPFRERQEENDLADFELILEAYKYRGYPKGARSIYMRLLHLSPPVIMNLKKIRRLMKKFNLVCPIRGANPYRQMARAIKTNHVAPNIVNRDFKSRGARKILLTDITYLFFENGRCYLSTVIDAVTHEVLAYQLSTSLQVDFVIDTITELKQKYGCELDNNVLVHSDQGCHYTSKAFIQKLHDENFVQSMSRKGNCWDNAPQESFFGHMKDEISAFIAECETFKEVKRIVDDWMDYYNNDRYQWDLLKLSPAEYSTYLKTKVYPLKVGQSKNSGSTGALPRTPGFNA
ncbi:MAG: IS3 family transposase [Clostridiales bacterium]|nr:IS3 family transposase [Clostridiales bacterium]